ncbi:MAG: LCP family protein [Clostridia bacterium]|nr:LCP family protein [Clostridia bacterium]
MAPGSYRQKRKSTKVTKALLITTWLLIVLLLGFGFLFISKEIQKQSEDNSQFIGDPSAPSVYNKNALVILTDSTGQDLMKFILINFNDQQSKISVAALPDTMETTVKYKNGSLREQFEYGGPLQVRAAVENALSISVDKHIVCPLGALEQTVENLGGVEYTLQEELYYKDSSGAVLTDLKKGTQTLNGQQVVKFLRYPKWGDDAESANECAKLFNAAINQYATEDTAKKIPQLFSDVVNQLNTDVSVMDILELQEKYSVFVNAKTPAKVISVSGTKDRGFKASEDTLKNLKEAFK